MAGNYQFTPGWKPSIPDVRDRIYAKPFVAANLPREVDLSTAPELKKEPWLTIWQQSNLGSCGPQSSGVDLVQAGLARQKRPSMKKPSALMIYYGARLIMGTVDYDSGVDNRSLMKALVNYGYCDEELWPYEISRFRVKPSAEAIAQAATRKIKSYSSVLQNLDAMRTALANGDSFIYGFTVYSSFQSNETERTGYVSLPSNVESVLGGHDVLICGYSDELKAFKFRNSYGIGWGDRGYGYMPYEYAINPRLSGDFWSIEHDGTATPVVPVDPKPIEEPKKWTMTVSGVGERPNVIFTQ